jgi:DNA-binding HxlR family transcriptional regulator
MGDVTARRSYEDPCGVARSLDILGERWALLVVRDLLLGPKRFGDLLRGLPGVSPNVLSQRLRDLTDHGVVSRRDLGAPARVHLYELTEWGHRLEPVLLHLGIWGSQAPFPGEGELGVDSFLLGVKAAFAPEGAEDLHGTYELRIDDDAYTVELTDGALQIRREPCPSPEATLATGIGTLRAIRNGRTTWAEAVQAGDLHLHGDHQAAKRLTDLLA